MANVLFDLDGTLFDTSEGIIRGFEEVEKTLKIDPIIRDEKKAFIGPPLLDVFQDKYSMTESDAKKAVKTFREYYDGQGKYECVPYAGIEDVLSELYKNDISLYIATSKPTRFAKEIVKHFKMDGFFVDIVGSNLDNTRSGKQEVIEYIIEKYNCNNYYTIMIGDKRQDVIGAKNTGIKSVGVFYGFGTETEIVNSKPNKIAKSVQDIPVILREYEWW